MRVNGFEVKSYLVKWYAEVAQVDQYDRYVPNGEIFYSKVFPTREQAEENLNSVTVPNQFVKGRRVHPDAPHSYFRCRVICKEEPVPRQASNEVCGSCQGRGGWEPHMAPSAVDNKEWLECFVCNGTGAKSHARNL